ncbi:MAG: hypothetical protein V4819_03490 [Verrucomicrobiota bacterium]
MHALLYAVAWFTGIPVTAAALLETIEALATAKTAQASGGKSATALKNQNVPSWWPCSSNSRSTCK